MIGRIFIAAVGIASVSGAPLEARGAHPDGLRGVAAVSNAAPPFERQPLAKACVVQHSTEVRYRGFGYDHYVHIANGCDADVACTVHTSDNADAIQVNVPGQRRVEVLVQRGSPAASFTASVYCKAT